MLQESYKTFSNVSAWVPLKIDVKTNNFQLIQAPNFESMNTSVFSHFPFSFSAKILFNVFSLVPFRL